MTIKAGTPQLTENCFYFLPAVWSSTLRVCVNWECGITIQELIEPLQKLKRLHLNVNSVCTHKNEPGCAVLKALETGGLEIDRWNSYQKLKAESSYIEDKESYLIAKGKREKEISKLIKKMPIRV